MKTKNKFAKPLTKDIFNIDYKEEHYPYGAIVSLKTKNIIYRWFKKQETDNQ